MYFSPRLLLKPKLQSGPSCERWNQSRYKAPRPESQASWVVLCGLDRLQVPPSLVTCGITCPLALSAGDRQLIGAWQPWKFCLKVRGQRCLSRLCWEGGGSHLTVGPAGHVRRSSAWLTQWERKEWLSRLPFFSLRCVWAISPPPFRPLEMFEGVPRLPASRARGLTSIPGRSEPGFQDLGLAQRSYYWTRRSLNEGQRD